MITKLTFTPGNHAYYLTDDAGKKTRLTSVTTLLNLLAKPALVKWAANTAADYATDHWDDLTALPPSQRRAEIATAPDRARDTAAAKGTAIHTYAEDLLEGNPVDVPDEILPKVQALARWLDAQRGMIVAGAERMVWSPEDEEMGLCGFAGTFDASVIHPIYGRLLLDWKTGKGVYDDMAVQLAAYAHADWHVVDEVDRFRPVFDAAAVVHIRPDGCTLHLLDRDQMRIGWDRFQLLRGLKYAGTPTFTEAI